MPVKQIFPLQNDFKQGDELGICTAASLQWAKKCLELGRGLGSFDELGLTEHQLNALMAVWRKFDNNPAAQTEGMGLKIVGGADHAVTQISEVQRITNETAPHVCIFWNNHHTMGYRVSTTPTRECEFFDMENGLWLADNDADIRQHIIDTFVRGNYKDVEGMRVLQI
jgi:hypothetical protein